MEAAWAAVRLTFRLRWTTALHYHALSSTLSMVHLLIRCLDDLHQAAKFTTIYWSDSGNWDCPAIWYVWSNKHWHFAVLLGSVCGCLCKHISLYSMFLCLCMWVCACVCICVSERTETIRVQCVCVCMWTTVLLTLTGQEPQQAVQPGTCHTSAHHYNSNYFMHTRGTSKFYLAHTVNLLNVHTCHLTLWHTWGVNRVIAQRHPHTKNS